MKLGFLRGIVLLILGSVVGGLILTGCKADIILPKDRGLDGDYAGLLIIITNQNNNVPVETDTDHVVVTLRLDDENDLTVGTYSHRFDTLNTDTTDTPNFCDMPRGAWLIKNLKLRLDPGPPAVSETCNDKLIPNSIFEGAGGTQEEINFSIRTSNNPPFDDDIGDSLILKQERNVEGITTVFELVLTNIP